MTLLIVVVHVIVCFAIILFVLLQPSKGDMGTAFGSSGMSQSLLGATGASTFLSKATTVIAIIFMLSSLTLSYLYSHRTNASSIMLNDKTPIQTAPKQIPKNK